MKSLNPELLSGAKASYSAMVIHSFRIACQRLLDRLFSQHGTAQGNPRHDFKKQSSSRKFADHRRIKPGVAYDLRGLS